MFLEKKDAKKTQKFYASKISKKSAKILEYFCGIFSTKKLILWSFYEQNKNVKLLCRNRWKRKTS